MQAKSIAYRPLTTRSKASLDCSQKPVFAIFAPLRRPLLILSLSGRSLWYSQLSSAFSGGYCVRVLSKMTDRAVALVDRVGGNWLTRTGGTASVHAEELAILRRLAMLSSVALVAVPAGLSLVTSPAVALPAGFATVCAGFLFSAVGSIALARQKPLEM